MKITGRTLGNQWIGKIFVCVGILSFSTTASAEYYIDCAFPPPVIELKGCAHAVKHRKPVHVKKVKKVSHRAVVSRPKVEVYYIWNISAPCGGDVCGCDEWTRPCYRCGADRWRTARDNAFYAPSDATRVVFVDDYDPDLSTGDDNAFVHPDMNIDY